MCHDYTHLSESVIPTCADDDILLLSGTTIKCPNHGDVTHSIQLVQDGQSNCQYKLKCCNLTSHEVLLLFSLYLPLMFPQYQHKQCCHVLQVTPGQIRVTGHITTPKVLDNQPSGTNHANILAEQKVACGPGDALVAIK